MVAQPGPARAEPREALGDPSEQRRLGWGDLEQLERQPAHSSDLADGRWSGLTGNEAMGELALEWTLGPDRDLTVLAASPLGLANRQASDSRGPAARGILWFRPGRSVQLRTLDLDSSRGDRLDPHQQVAGMGPLG